MALSASGPSSAAPLLLMNPFAALVQQTVREEAVASRFTAEFPSVAVVPVSAQPADVHDVDGLRTIGDALAAGTS